MAIPINRDHIVSGLNVRRLVSADYKHGTDHWRAFKNAVMTSEPDYPGIRRWLDEKVGPSLAGGDRRAYLICHSEQPIATAVLKRGSRAKLCHVRVEEAYQDWSIGELLFSVLILDTLANAKEIHFTLPEGLWHRRKDFFQSFAFAETVQAVTQYRLFERELHCAAPASEVRARIFERLPGLAAKFDNCTQPKVPALIMSLHRLWAEAILNGKKTVEIRKRFSARWCGQRISLYASGLSGALVGEATISHVSVDEPSKLWDVFGAKMGCSQKEYEAYVGVSPRVSAIHLTDVRPYSGDVPLIALSGRPIRPPQSFSLLRENSEVAQAVSLASAISAMIPRIAL